MALISLKNIHLRYSDESLFEDVTLHIRQGDKIGLLGRNGSGKTTLLKLIAGDIQPDRGSVAVQKEAKIARLMQDAAGDFSGSTRKFCFSPEGKALLPVNGALIKDLQDEDFSLELDKNFTRLSVNPDAEYSLLSGGEKRRVHLALALACLPDVLLLDEPTNHLDISTIQWLESHLRRSNIALVMVTHDRRFAAGVTNRISELDRGQLYSFDCGYDEFLRRRENIASAQDKAEQEFDKKLAEEEAWLRKGIKARRTRNEGRVRALQAMREEHRNRRQKTGRVRFSIEEARRSGDLVAELDDVSFSYSEGPTESPLISSFTASVLRGDRIGIVGDNGAGKTTLARLITGDLRTDSGKIRLGTGLSILYFDQLRTQLDPQKTIRENIAGDDDAVVINEKSRHINAYLKDFLFDPEDANKPVHILSGGEKNRLLFAKLFLQSANVLVLDEPTNDLDMETLELLEDLLADFSGTVIMISHDRAFLDNCVSDLFIFTPSGTIESFVGSYSQWEDQQKAHGKSTSQLSKPENASKPGKKPKTSAANKLSYREKQELESLPESISSMESRIAEIEQTLADPLLYQGDEAGEKTRALSTELQELNNSLEDAYERWDTLEQKQG